MDIEYLREFVTYASNASLAKTSHELHLSTSAISRHLTALEKEFGAPLFQNRSANELTPVGESVLGHAIDVLRLYDEMVESASLLKSSKRRNLLVAYLPNERQFIEAFSFLRETLAATLPECQVRIVEPRDHSLFDLLNTGTIDMALTVGSPDLMNSTFERLPVTTGGVFVSLQDELGISGDTVLLSDLEGLSLMRSLDPVYRDYTDWVASLFSSHGVNVKTQFINSRSVDDYSFSESKSKMLFLPEASAGNEGLVRAANVHRRLYRILDADVDGSIYAFWRSDALADECKRLAGLLAEYFATRGREGDGAR